MGYKLHIQVAILCLQDKTSHAEEKSKKILADAEENHKKNLVELGSEMEKLLETKKQELDLEIENYLRIESDRITMEKQRAISEGTIEIEKVREKAIDKKEPIATKKTTAQAILKNQRFIQRYKNLDAQLQNTIFGRWRCRLQIIIW